MLVQIWRIFNNYSDFILHIFHVSSILYGVGGFTVDHATLLADRRDSAGYWVCKSLLSLITFNKKNG